MLVMSLFNVTVALCFFFFFPYMYLYLFIYMLVYKLTPLVHSH